MWDGQEKTKKHNSWRHIRPLANPNPANPDPRSQCPWLVFTSNPTLVKTSVSVPGISDRDVVVSDFDAKPQIHHQKARKYNRFGKANLEKLKDDMNNAADITEEEKRAGKDVDKLWTTFKNQLNTAMEGKHTHFPTQTITHITMANCPTQEDGQREEEDVSASQGEERLVCFSSVPETLPKGTPESRMAAHQRNHSGRPR